MGRPQNCVCCHKSRQMIIALLFLLISSFTHVRFVVEGRAISKLIESAKRGIEQEKVVVVRSQLGSRPPRCEGKCRDCGHCEAIQVPVTTRALPNRRNNFSDSIPSIVYSRDNDISNYKPMSWKCKCGKFIFNP